GSDQRKERRTTRPRRTGVRTGMVLGGKPPRRGGKLTRKGEPEKGPEPSQLLALTLGCLLLGAAAGFGWAMDRQLRGGLLDQRREAMARPDWVSIESLPEYVPRTFLSVVDPTFDSAGAVR